MKASIGDRLVVGGRHVGDTERTAEVVEVHGEDGAPPYLVRWIGDGHESLYVPGSDVTVEHVAAPPASVPRAGARPAAGPAPDASETEVRLARLEDEIAALAREAESLREDLRALAAAVREGEAPEA